MEYEPKKVAVLSHAVCADGFTAAWVFWRRYGDTAVYEFLKHDEQAPVELVRGKHVFMTDFCFNEVEKMLAVADAAASLTVLDHHKTAAPILEELRTLRPAVTVVFDNDRSGARLAWDHLNPDFVPPPIVMYVEDRDLWRWAMPRSKEVNACLSSYSFGYDMWDTLAATPVDQLAAEGSAILRYKDREVKAHTAQARAINWEGHRVLVTNASSLISEVGGALAEGRPFGVVWFQRGDGKYNVSLRSREGGVDVSEIAKKHGGGGHFAAAGFAAAELPF